ncbi:BgTH12-03881 [Blumeria graminis f. sp. triticale]|uniref:BgtA-20878 n=3 Tax=Blumeria graminis TaxID=34373 RepID=A0A9X9L994_BLUGR|nr:hypothetical protein BGT96224_A20878 [Blumeria graminis f. sp. tritici 96224]CAD6499773.1 BgTH12-03881 [Blumeria graminis f. sp. triticale]VCU39942.1 BgtA-20878 [Blumeria graminis f. sp. tritici]
MPNIEQIEDDPAPINLINPAFKPISRSHILHCSYQYWYSKYRSSCIKSRIIPLTDLFLNYLREDGIILPDEVPTTASPETSFIESINSHSEWDEAVESSPHLAFPEIHQKIKDTILELGGSVAPKLNWSAPKDATWISMKKNSMECSSPNDIYLLLKSSDFITHDLEHAFDDTTNPQEIGQEDINYILVLRKWFQVNPACEFRCFVRERKLIGICQRDLNHFSFLFAIRDKIRDKIKEFFENTLVKTFPDPEFVFDVYLPEPYERVRLIDINPWAPKTDPLLFSWIYLLSLPLPQHLLGLPDSEACPSLPSSSSDNDTPDEDVGETDWVPEIRLVRKDDPRAYNFASSQYSAHKLPREVVEAGMQGENAIRDFATQWEKMMNGQAKLWRSEISDEDDI